VAPEPKMEARPPALADAIVRALIPPACREAVIGDLWERYTSPAAYLGDALRALPFLIASRIRRTTNALMLAMAFLILFVSFGPSPGPAFPRALVPAVAVLAAFVLRDVYRDVSRSIARRATGDAVAVLIAAAVAETALAVTRPELLLTRAGILTGSLTCLALIAGRLAGPRTEWRESLAGGTALTLDQLRSEMSEAEGSARRTRLAETGAGVLVIAGGLAGMWFAPDSVAKIGLALMAAGAAFVVAYLHRHAMPAMPMDLDFESSRAVFRDALVRGERLLRTVWLWYLLPLLAGPLVLIVGLSAKPGRSPVQVAAFLLVVGILTALVAGMNMRVARSLARRIAALDQTHERK
jgi:hypothetical protein